ncbi:MAG: SPOR domain-containing protein [Crocinitomicaceae bacterium]|nr:SPOR domain-containing protein [Crocinitomicaceae bacterium]
MKTHIRNLFIKFTQTNSTDNKSSATVSGPIRKAKAIDFTDEAGKQAGKEYYVVIGSFESKKNAQKWKKKSEANGDNNTKILYDSQLKMNQVVVFYTDKQDSAMTEILKRSSKQKAWVLYLE